MNNRNEVDFSSVFPMAQLERVLEQDEYSRIDADLREAAFYMKSREWCAEIVDTCFGLGVGNVFCVFLFHIRPSRPDIEEYLWVVVGDIPPLYLVTESASTPAMALSCYAEIMMTWAEAAISQNRQEGLPPVAAPFTVENGNSLRRRLNFIENYLAEHCESLVLPSPHGTR